MRVFLCTSLCYPYGSAVSGRLHSVAKGLKKNNIEPIIISQGKNIETEYVDETTYVHDGVRYCNCEMEQKMVYQFKNRKSYIELLNKFQPNSNDVIYVYSNLCFFTKQILVNICYKYKCKLFFDISEWHESSQLKMRFFHPYYISFLINAFFIMPKADGIICISNYLSRKAIWRKQQKLVLPTIIDVDSKSFKNNKTCEFSNFIYPGNPGKKDDFASMLMGFSLLSDEEKHKIKFHITSVNQETLRVLLGKKAYLLDELKDIVVYHNWLKYDELLELYSTVHFLLISKPDNIVSKANFPSKVPELMACGVVPVITKVGDITEYVTDGVDSLLINGNEPKEIANSMRKAIALSQSEFENMSKNARKTAEEKFDYRKWSERLVDFIIKT